jgi:hypothetical protein
MSAAVGGCASWARIVLWTAEVGVGVETAALAEFLSHSGQMGRWVRGRERHWLIDRSRAAPGRVGRHGRPAHGFVISRERAIFARIRSLPGSGDPTHQSGPMRNKI